MCCNPNHVATNFFLLFFFTFAHFFLFLLQQLNKQADKCICNKKKYCKRNHNKNKAWQMCWTCSDQWLLATTLSQSTSFHMFVCMYEHFWLRFHISICGISAEQINTAHLPQAARAKNNRGRRRRRRICTVYKANGSKWLHLSEFPSYTCVRHYYHIQFNLSSSSIQFERC